MRIATRGVVVGLAVLLLAAAGCSGGDEEEAVETLPERAESGDTAVVDVEPPSVAASSRGVVVSESGEDAELEPMIMLGDITYEWRTSPQKGLSVTLDFVNPNDTYERARGYVFVIAGYGASRGGIYGVYPWGAEIVDEIPVDYAAGTHLLFRRDQQVRGFIPYENSEGFYDVLKIVVFSEDGELLYNSTLDLEVTGEPTGAVKPPRTINL